MKSRSRNSSKENARVNSNKLNQLSPPPKQSSTTTAAQNLQEKLRVLREQRAQKEIEKRKKNWDNLDPIVVERIQHLEGHKEYIAQEKQDVLQNKKSILFRQKYQLLSNTTAMESHVDRIIDQEKDKLIDVFDDQLSQTRRSFTPANSFYTNSRLNRSSSLDISSFNNNSTNSLPNHQAIIQNNRPQRQLSIGRAPTGSAKDIPTFNNQSSFIHQVPLTVNTLNHHTQLQLINESFARQLQSQDAIVAQDLNSFRALNSSNDHYFGLQSSQSSSLSVAGFRSPNEMVKVAKRIDPGNNSTTSLHDETALNWGSQATNHGTTLSFSEQQQQLLHHKNNMRSGSCSSASHLNFTNEHLSNSCGRSSVTPFDDRNKSDGTLKRILDSSPASSFTRPVFDFTKTGKKATPKHTVNSSSSGSLFNNNHNNSLLDSNNIFTPSASVINSQTTKGNKNLFNQGLLQSNSDNFRFSQFSKELQDAENQINNQVNLEVKLLREKVAQLEQALIDKEEQLSESVSSIKQVSSNKNKTSQITRDKLKVDRENLRLRRKVVKLENENAKLSQQKSSSKRVIAAYENQLDGLFEAIFENEKELKLLRKQEQRSSKALEELFSSEQNVSNNFEEFKNKLENMLTGYSQQLEVYNRNELYSMQLSEENQKLKHERDRLALLLSQSTGAPYM